MIGTISTTKYNLLVGNPQLLVCSFREMSPLKSVSEQKTPTMMSYGLPLM